MELQNHLGIGKAVGKYMELTEDEKTRMLAEMRERAIRDDLSRIYYATEDGRAEGHADTARRMKAKGMDTSVIAECTGLSESEIAAL